MSEILDNFDGFDDDTSSERNIRRRRSRPIVPKIRLSWGDQVIKLRAYQVVFLRLLALEQAPLTKGYLLRVVADHGGNDSNWDYILTHSIGVPNPRIRDRKEKRLGYPSLITLGLVSYRYLVIEEHKTPVYEITELGIEIAREAGLLT